MGLSAVESLKRYIYIYKLTAMQYPLRAGMPELLQLLLVMGGVFGFFEVF